MEEKKNEEASASQPADGAEEAPVKPVDSQTPTPPSQLKSSTRGGKKSLITIIGAVFGVLFVGAVIGYAVLLNSPQAKIADALQKLAASESISIDYELEGDVLGEAGVGGVGGKIVTNTANKELMAGIGVDLQVTEATADFMYSGGDYYFRIGGLDGLDQLIGPFLEGFTQGFAGNIPGGTTSDQQQFVDQIGVEVSKFMIAINDQWIRIEGSVVEQAGFDMDGLFDDVQMSLGSAGNITDGFEIKEVLDDDTIDGRSAIHARVAFKPAELQPILAEMFAGISVGGDTLTQEEVEKGVEDFFDEYDPEEDILEVWVDKETVEIVRMSLSGDDGEGDDMMLTFNFSDHNSVAPLTVPEDPITVLELYGMMTESLQALGLTEADLEELVDPSALGL
ncbi:MAG: hypothetical protein GY745_21290 [Actinomycetia bacterium]|nr:hypothetical protein [Actinomycetes bacterium]